MGVWIAGGGAAPGPCAGCSGGPCLSYYAQKKEKVCLQTAPAGRPAGMIRPPPGAGGNETGALPPDSGASEASRFGLWLPGLPGPDPGHFFLGEKVTKTPPGVPPGPPFTGVVQSVSIWFDTALPLN